MTQDHCPLLPLSTTTFLPRPLRWHPRRRLGRRMTMMTAPSMRRPPLPPHLQSAAPPQQTYCSWSRWHCSALALALQLHQSPWTMRGSSPAQQPTAAAAAAVVVAVCVFVVAA